MCDTFARIGLDGSLFAKNSDRPRGEAQVVEWHPRRVATRQLRTQYLSIQSVNFGMSFDIKKPVTSHTIPSSKNLYDMHLKSVVLPDRAESR